MDELYEAIYRGMAPKAKIAVQASLEAAKTPQDIIDGSMIPAMEAIGADFESGKAFVPNLLLSARAMKSALDILKPLMMAEQTVTLGTVVIGTVKGDLHDIGKNLVKMMLEGKGLEVIDLGTDVSPEMFVETAKKEGCRIIACSALLTTTMGTMAEVVRAAEAAGIRDQVKIMVGGAPLNAEFAAKIGADGYSSNANEAVTLAKSLLN